MWHTNEIANAIFQNSDPLSFALGGQMGRTAGPGSGPGMDFSNQPLGGVFAGMDRPDIRMGGPGGGREALMNFALENQQFTGPQILSGQAGGLGGGMDPGGGMGLAALIGEGGMMPNLDDASSYWGEHEGQGWEIAPGMGETPMGLPELEDPYWETPAEIPPIYDPPPPIYDPPPPIYDPPSYDPPIDIRGTSIETGSFTPPGSGTPGSPGFAFNFPMPAIDPLGGAPGMPSVGFYSVNSGAAGLPIPAFGGLENPNMLSSNVQQFVGGPDVLTRALS